MKRKKNNNKDNNSGDKDKDDKEKKAKKAKANKKYWDVGYNLESSIQMMNFLFFC